MEADLRQALQEQQLSVFYQPIVSFKNGQLVGFEALLRWRHPERGFIQPLEFIPLAQETGLIIPVDQWVIEEACRQVQEWQARFQFDPPLKISVNIANSLIAQTDLTGGIKRILQNTGMDKQNLRLEITESAVAEYNGPMARIITELNNMGVEVQIDNFGTGYSSLVYLQKFPVAALKIDHTFIHRLQEQEGNIEIVSTIIDLAHDLGMQAFAEGIETEAQLSQLKAMGCDCGQGFLLSPPLDSEATGAMLADGEIEAGAFAPWGELLDSV
jgi:EAL domain-containing protein (putative c-di-GMP-specific phosphodiesterase class I)